MKCKVCNEEINVHVSGQPEDTCWACLPNRIDVLSKNISAKQDKKYEEIPVIAKSNLTPIQLGGILLLQLFEQGILTDEEIAKRASSGGGLDATEYLSLTLQKECQRSSVNGIIENLKTLDNIIEAVSKISNDTDLGCEIRKIIIKSQK